MDKSIEIKNTIISFSKFIKLYEYCTTSTKLCAGTIILNPELTKIVLVKGKISGKWSFPKGHRDKYETNLETATRETYEETGLKLQLKVPLLPYFIIDKIKLYFLIIEESTELKIIDNNEITQIQWFTCSELEEHMTNQDYIYEYNASIKKLFKKKQTLDMIKSKIISFAPNYIPSQDNFINVDLEKVTKQLKSITPIESKFNYHYHCFQTIQSCYNNIFNNNDLIYFTKTYF